MSIHTCPFCGKGNLLYDAERSIEKRKELIASIGKMNDEGRISAEEMRSYQWRLENMEKRDKEWRSE